MAEAAQEGSPDLSSKGNRAKDGKDAHMEKDVLEWKRNVAIEQRELAYLEAQEAKQQERIARWELESLERENLTAAARERKKRAFHKALALQKESEAKSDYRQRMREIKLNQKEAAWQQKEAGAAKKVCERARFEERETERILSEVRERKLEMLKAERETKQVSKAEAQVIHKKRDKAIEAKERRRVEKDLLRVRKVQLDFEEELGHELPDAEVPMKATLVHAVHAPSVSELNFALRDLRENLEDLRSCDMERRAKSQGVRVFQLVRQMEDEAKKEWDRVHKSVGVK